MLRCGALGSVLARSGNRHFAGFSRRNQRGRRRRNGRNHRGRGRGLARGCDARPRRTRCSRGHRRRSASVRGASIQEKHANRPENKHGESSPREERRTNRQTRRFGLVAWSGLVAERTARLSGRMRKSHRGLVARIRRQNHRGLEPRLRVPRHRGCPRSCVVRGGEIAFALSARNRLDFRGNVTPTDASHQQFDELRLHFAGGRRQTRISDRSRGSFVLRRVARGRRPVRICVARFFHCRSRRSIVPNALFQGQQRVISRRRRGARQVTRTRQGRSQEFQIGRSPHVPRPSAAASDLLRE